MENDKKTEQEKRAAEFKKQETLKKYKEISTRVALWGGVTIALVAGVWGLAKYGNNPTTSTTTTTLSVAVLNDDHARGNTLSKITLVEYSDFQCPACLQFYPVVKSVEQKYGNKFLLVYRYYPLPTHDKSDIAARAAEAAGKQGRFWEMHDKLFENQTTWAVSSNPEQLFSGYAQALGLDIKKFESDLKDPATETRIVRDIGSGNDSGVEGTPTFYLNGKKLIMQTYGDLETAIASAIAESK